MKHQSLSQRNVWNIPKKEAEYRWTPLLFLDYKNLEIETRCEETKSCYPYLKISGKELYLSQVSLRCFISKFEKSSYIKTMFSIKRMRTIDLWMDL